jgi:hypothetical protein
VTSAPGRCLDEVTRWLAIRIDTTDHDTGTVLRVRVSDKGQGGADPTRGTGLVGLTDRVEALGGHLSIHTAPGAGTTLQAEFPLPRPPQGLGKVAMSGCRPAVTGGHRHEFGHGRGVIIRVSKSLITQEGRARAVSLTDRCCPVPRGENSMR